MGDASVSSGPGSRGPLAKLAIILVLLSMILAACGGGGDDKADEGEGGIVKEETTEDEGKPVPGGTVTMGVEAESAGWQPCVDSHSESGTMVMRSIYDPLTARGEDGEVRPFLAESLESNPDATEWTLKVRSGVKFHDGTDLTADVLKNNFDAAKQPTSRCFG